MFVTLSLIIVIFIIDYSTSQPINFPPPNTENFQRNRITPPEEPEISYAYIYEGCKHYGNSSPVAMEDLVLVNKYGLRIAWNKNLRQRFDLDNNNVDESYKGFDDIRGIFDCTITVKLGPHDKTISYQEMIFGFMYWIQFDENKDLSNNRSSEIKRLDPKNTIANKGLNELQTACRPAGKSYNDINCEYLGCVVIKYGNKTFSTCNIYSGSNMGDKLDWYTRDDISIRILLIGSFIGKDDKNGNVPITYPPFNTMIILDFTRLFAGPCDNIKQFYCPTHGVCIKYQLACDRIYMRNCPVYEPNKYDDENACTVDSKNIPPAMNKPDPNAMQNLIIFWVFLGLFLSFLVYLLLNYLFWRPGYLVWRLGRLRNCFKFGNCCYKYCHSCSKGNCAQCCKTSGQFDTTDPPTVSWSKFAMGDGFHMRENR